MRIKRFEDLDAWKLSQDLAVQVYQFHDHVKDYGFKDQIQRASVSISNNVAEGFDRNYQKEFQRFLYIGKGSCGEVKSMAYLGNRLGYLNLEQRDQLLSQCNRVSGCIYGLIRSL